jgi:hypothetical protein
MLRGDGGEPSDREGGSIMTTDVGHGRKRRGRRAGVKRRTPRAAIAAGALAAASIPLWPSSAGAEHTDPWLPHSPDEFKSETRTVIVAGVSCRIRVASGRNDEYVHASTNIESSQPECTNASWTLAMDYVTLGGREPQSRRLRFRYPSVAGGPACARSDGVLPRGDVRRWRRTAVVHPQSPQVGRPWTARPATVSALASGRPSVSQGHHAGVEE